MSNEAYDKDSYYPDGGRLCPRCNGDGSINCHCGGDLCFCENQGEAPCPLCWEEGEVSDEIANRFLEKQRKFQEALLEAQTS